MGQNFHKIEAVRLEGGDPPPPPPSGQPDRFIDVFFFNTSLTYFVLLCVTLCYLESPCVTLCYFVSLCVTLCHLESPCVTEKARRPKEGSQESRTKASLQEANPSMFAFVLVLSRSKSHQCRPLFVSFPLICPCLGNFPLIQDLKSIQCSKMLMFF